MSFYTHPYAFGPHSTRAHHPATGPAAHHPLSHASPQQQYNFFTGTPPPAPHFAHPPYPFTPHHQASHLINPHEDFEAEERAAFLHLRDIQRRRELASQIERQRQAEVARERAIAQEIERRQAFRAEHERRLQAAHAYKQEVIRRNVLAAQQAVAGRQQQARAVRAMVEDRKRQYLESLFGHQQQQQQEQQEQQQQVEAQARQRCAAHCARRAGHPCQRRQPEQEQEEEKDAFEGLNSMLGALFGINLSEDKPEEKSKEKKEVVETKNPESTAVPAEPTTTHAATTADKSLDADKKSEDADAFPSEINDILQSFLGLHVDPASTSEGSADTSTKNGVPDGLNELLGQFGLVFEPDTPATSEQPIVERKQEKEEVKVTSSASTSTAPAPATVKPPRSKKADKTDAAPLTAFLNGFTDLPPFVRDILENVEVAFKEELKEKKQEKEKAVEGKGKGVAAGEKKGRSAPVPTGAPVAPTVPETPVTETSEDSSDSSLSSLSNISNRLNDLQSTFTFPPHLSFSSPNNESSEATPALLFNKHNAKYHSQAHSLLQLLLAADSVTSGGNKDVRRKRKEVVRQVEGAIEELERKRDAVWQGVKERRERGEASDWEDEDGSETSSVSGGDHEDKKETGEEEQVVEEEKKDVEQKDEEKKVEGYEVPTESKQVEETQDAEVTPTKDRSEDISRRVESSDTEKKDGEEHEEVKEKKLQAKVEDKEDGYELL